MRGFVREILALAGWVIAFVVARLYTVELASRLPDAIPSAELKFLAAFLILFLSSLLLCSLLAIAIAQLFKTVGLSAGQGAGWLVWPGARFVDSCNHRLAGWVYFLAARCALA
ncbi:CvpA family protein [Methylobacillus glycogenes]|uniref:CvpA family protein n=1 Tax=Methylobacillus glycogenes TaxID=406 RepID=UPI0034E2A505